MTKQYSVAEARSHLPGLLDEVEAGSPVEITRRGKPVAIVLSVGDYERLARLRRGFWDAVEEWRATVDWDDWDDSVIDDLLAHRDRAPGRDFSWPE